MSRPAESAPGAPAAPSTHDPAGEYLAGILAMSRLSRVTVACKSAPYPGAKLLAIAKLTGIPGETALVFDEWQHAAGPDLATTLAAAGGDAGPLLAILDDFDAHLRLPADDPRALADGRALCALAADPRADVHFLLLLAESAAPLLQRYAAQIPGIAEASLRLPPPLAASDAGAKAPERKRSFGSLLERLNERSAEVPATASAHHEIEDRAAQASVAPLMREGVDEHGAGNFWHDEPDDAPVAADAGHAAMPREQEAPAVPEAQAAAPLEETAAPPMEEQETPPSVVAAPVAAEMPREQPAERIGLPEEATPIRLPETVALAAPAVAALQTAPRPSAPVAALPPRPKRGMRAGYVAVAGIAAVAIGWMLMTRLPRNFPQGTQQVQATPPAPQATQKAAAQPPAAMAAAGSAAAAAAAAPDKPAKEAAPPAAPSVATAKAPAAPAPAAVAVAAAPAEPAPAALPAGRTALYIVVGNNRDRERVRPIAQTLSRQGIRIVAVSQGDGGPSISDLRYFYPDERDDALKVQQALQQAGIAVRKVNLVPGYEDRATHRQFELWLANDGALDAGAPGLAPGR